MTPPRTKKIAERLARYHEADGAIVALLIDGNAYVAVHGEKPTFMRVTIELVDLRAGALECLHEALQIIESDDHE